MKSLFRARSSQPAAVLEPVPTEFPEIPGAQMAAVFCDARVAGDFYDALRVSQDRVLFGLLDVAGRREDTRSILVSAQKIFRGMGAELFGRPDLNEAEAMTELCLLINRAIIDASAGVRSCPAFLGCYQQDLGTLCYTNAGHTPGLLRDGAGTIQLPSTGLPLGLFSHATADAPTVALPRGAALLLVSRGVLENEGDGNYTEDLRLGLEQIERRFQQAPQSDAQELCRAILHWGVEGACGEDRTAMALLRQS